MLFIILQIACVLTSLAGIWFVGRTDPVWRRIGFWLGLLCQGFWGAIFIKLGTPLLLIVSIAHALAWWSGLRNCPRLHRDRGHRRKG